MDSLLASGWKGSMWFPDGFQVTWEGWQGFLQPPQYHVRPCCFFGGGGGLCVYGVVW